MEARRPIERLLREKLMVWIRVLAMDMGEEASSRIYPEDRLSRLVTGLGVSYEEKTRLKDHSQVFG